MHASLPNIEEPSSIPATIEAGAQNTSAFAKTLWAIAESGLQRLG